MAHGKGELCYKQIVVQGIVQGVGFRPFIFHLAQKHNLTGNVKNISGAVVITACGSLENMKQFIEDVETTAYPPMNIVNIELHDSEPFLAEDFKIIKSDMSADTENRFISPDLSLCINCLSEIENHSDRRYGHAFNSCVSCGPRFSIINNLPYDRENTSMTEFHMCDDCKEEYNSPKYRRFHAETICCKQCKPHLLYKTKQEAYTEDDGLCRAINALKQGKIIAIKGIGGYHFACLPFHSETVKALRSIKKRDRKPFAVMFQNIEEVKKICHINEKEISVLQSSENPITLLEMKKNIFAHEVLCGDFRCGCFLPYTALHHLILKKIPMLVMTSANLSGSAIVYNDDEMLAFYEKNGNEYFSGILYNEREIIRSAEDSVAQVIAEKQIQLIRRSRGYAPLPFRLENNQSFLAVGGDLKSAFCLVKNKYAYMSQYFGDLDDKNSFESFRASIDDYKNLFAIDPAFAVCDCHPSYCSAHFAPELGLPVLNVQHHHAHIASVMAEHCIQEKVIGVAFDGTGYGDDGCIWGGEFLICEGKQYKRVAHLNYIKMIGGDNFAIDARKTASCIIMKEEFDDRTPAIKAALDNNINVTLSSSMGRLFDAVSAVLGICDRNGYEGECAVLLQHCAERGLKDNVIPYPMHFDIFESNAMLRFDGEKMLRFIYEEYFVNRKADKRSFALGFHLACSEVIRNICAIIREREATNTVVLSGGVFQNKLLIELTIKGLEKSGFTVFINNLTPPNDGCISLGQAFIGSLSGGTNSCV